MATVSKGSLAQPDDPIFKEGPSFYTRQSDRISTRSTEPSPKTLAKASDPESQTKPPDPEGE